ncbi:translocon outer membrane complex 75-IV [Arabidopsis lyrata subsp. lyrata]|uniref:Translocon outer membrane complex 75-IV n=1 Tax=Arabidopsis lyrata subsp. lyrata TaxID=81972 RepID=D7LX68_ARALL|nr:translocon outer membrane complex 75-IV [Arabidopsis lyrata subsp. lyrata]
MEAVNEAVRKIKSLVIPHPDEKTNGIVLEIKLDETDQRSAKWSLDPSLALFEVTGSCTLGRQNFEGLNCSLMSAVTTSNIFDPKLDDLLSKLEYVRCLDGDKNPRNRTFKTSFFNSRKLSPVFTGGPGFEEVVPPMFVARDCLKATITENLTRQREFTYGVMLEEIIAQDENRKVSVNGLSFSPSGGISVNGPPTTLSGTGIDRIASLQANITRDNTKLVNGAIVGERNVFQVDQGLGIGSNFPLFNRHQLTLTRFIQLKQVEEGSGNPRPPVLVLHGHYGGCIGDLPNYDAFALGGPNSVRGYSMGELGAAKHILELSAEIRIPVKNTHVYTFAEHGNDLGSSKDVKGNPTAVYWKMGHGSSYGLGVKLGKVRAEYTVRHNRGTGALFLRFGERY